MGSEKTNENEYRPLIIYEIDEISIYFCTCIQSYESYVVYAYIYRREKKSTLSIITERKLMCGRLKERPGDRWKYQVKGEIQELKDQ